VALRLCLDRIYPAHRGTTARFSQQAASPPEGSKIDGPALTSITMLVEKSGIIDLCQQSIGGSPLP
jgi:hypothetical protein